MEPRISIITLGVADIGRAWRFYHEGLGFPTRNGPDEPIVFFETGGARLALYPEDKLAEDVAPHFPGRQRGAHPGITLAHNTRTKDEVDAILARAASLGGKIEKPAADTFWGGYSGYFSDPDGYLWEVAWAEFWRFEEDGSLILP